MHGRSHLSELPENVGFTLSRQHPITKQLTTRYQEPGSLIDGQSPDRRQVERGYERGACRVVLGCNLDPLPAAWILHCDDD